MDDKRRASSKAKLGWAMGCVLMVTCCVGFHSSETLDWCDWQAKRVN